MSTLPESVLRMVEYSPIEDIVLAALRKRLPDVRVQSLYRENESTPLVLIRRDPEESNWSGDPHHLDTAYIDVEVLTEGLEADTDGALLGEAVRVALRDTWLQRDIFPGLGHFVWVEQTVAPHKRSDWATATGPVQYADLPAGWSRYESSFYIEVRPWRG